MNASRRLTTKNSVLQKAMEPLTELWLEALFLYYSLVLCYTGRNGDVAHLVERGIRIAEVVGSSPIVSTSFWFCAAIAQW